MNDLSCVFCKIVGGQLPCVIVGEDEHVLAIENNSPRAPIHCLILPKKHVIDISAFSDNDDVLGWHILKMARDLSHSLRGCAAFNLVSNNGAEAGQSVFHMHFHFIAGKNIYSSGFKL